MLRKRSPSDGSGRVTIEGSAHLLIMAGLDIDEPLVVEGSFVVNSNAQVLEAIARLRGGEMGRLEPLPAEES